MEFQKRPRLTARDLSLLGLLSFVLMVVASILIGVNIGLIRSIGGGGEFYSPWIGARMFLLNHVDPYNLEVALESQRLAYGGNAESGQNPYFLSIPFFLLPIYFPFAFVSDSLSAVFSTGSLGSAALASGLWMLLNEVALITTVFLVLRLLGWTPSRFFLAALLLLSVFSYYSASALLEGSPVIMLCLLYFGTLHALENDHNELAGAFLALAFFRWEVGLLFIALVLWRVYKEKRVRVFYGFGMLMAVLLIVSFLMFPGWLIPFMRSAFAELRASYGFTMGEVLQHLWPDVNSRFFWIVPVGLILLLALEWYLGRQSDFHHFVWTCCLTLAVTPLLGFRTDQSNLVVLLPSLALVFSTAISRWRFGYSLTILLYLIALLLPWGLFVRSMVFHDPRYQGLLSLFFPIFVIAGLYWTRWWFIRPPRTWLEYARSSQA